MWERLAERLEGRLAVVEPLAYKHEEGLWNAATSDPEVWRWMQLDAAAGRSAFRSWLENALERAAAGSEAPFAVLDPAGERPLGSTRYLTLRPEHRGLEIGWTWLAPGLGDRGQCRGEAPAPRPRLRDAPLHAGRVQDGRP